LAKSKKISVMVSSRCKTDIKFKDKSSNLTEVRKELKKQLEAATFLDQNILEVWINETAPPSEGTSDSWDTCLRQVDDADIVLVLYNGDAGWTATDSGIGICHAELERALVQAPAKVWLITLNPMVTSTKETDVRFRDYVTINSLFTNAVTTGEEVIAKAKETLAAAVVHQVGLGLREAKKGRYHLGAALDWTRLDFENRKSSMEKILTEALGGAKQGLVNINGTNILFKVHAIPDTFATAEARELVGRPFLIDYKSIGTMPLKKAGNEGPVHLIGVHKTMTESQARTFIGHPNVILVNAPFGFYLADRIDHSQTIIVTECRDETSTRNGVQRCMDWLNKSGEKSNIIDRATKRKLIIQEIAKHQS
jgi:hypothetical protein